MTCIEPPELTDLQLAMYLNDDADAAIHAHLTRCPFCRDRAKELAQEQNSLRTALHRANCPDADTLRDYQFGLLSGHETGLAELHLQVCPYCTHHVATLREFVADLERLEEHDVTEPSMLRRIRWYLANAVDGGLRLGPSLGGVRGGRDESSASYAAGGSSEAGEGGEIRIDTAVRVDTKRPEQRVLVGSVIGPGTEIDDVAVGWSADLWLNGALIASEPLDDLYSFRFVNLRPGSYEIILSGPNTKIRVPAVAVK
ncbi:MAG: hypothetical protein ACK2UO_00695 [Caldilineaceae bacterium]|jgi:anti-sigma factor RsiW